MVNLPATGVLLVNILIQEKKLSLCLYYVECFGIRGTNSLCRREQITEIEQHLACLCEAISPIVLLQCVQL